MKKIILDKSYYQYTDYHLEPGGMYKLDLIMDFIDKNFPSKKMKILDVGCGNGNIAMPLACLGHQVTAIDEDREAIDAVKKKNKFSNLFAFNIKFEDYDRNSQFVNRDSQLANHESRFTIHDARFNLIIMSEFLEHTKEPEKVLEQAKSLLTDDGYLLVTAPNGRSVEELLRRIILRNHLLNSVKTWFKKRFIKSEIQTPAQSPHLHFWSYRQIEELINRAGFKIEQDRVLTSFAKEFFYIIGRIFIKRGGMIFNIVNKIDNFFARHIPVRFGSNWLMVLKKDD